MEIRADKPLADADVVKCMTKVVGRDVSKFPERQSWGWPGTCDVYNPEGNVLGVGGAWYSFDDADEYSRKIAEALKELGYKVRRTKAS